MAEQRPVAKVVVKKGQVDVASIDAAAPTGPKDPTRAVVFGLLRDVPRALEHPAFTGLKFNIVGVLPLDEEPNVEETVAALQALVTRERAGTLLAAGPVGHELMARVSDLALVQRRRLVAVMPTEVLSTHQPVVVWEGESPLVQLSAESRPAWQAWVKRGVDILGAAVGLVIASPALAVAIVAVKLESRGPTFFRHWRVGYKGRRFACLKLRTMRVDAEDILANDEDLREAYRRNDYKLPDDQDPRVTPVGRVLRRVSLDEVPQLWNVLVGDMSLVGPRPVVEDELEHYIGTSSVLVSVRPGLTGAWAVSGRHHVGYPRRADLELAYVRGWSLMSDLRILLKTPSAVFDPGTEAL